jgi:type I restriction enzyme S subunit
MSAKGWKKYKLGQIIDDIAMGPFGSNIKVDNFIAEGVPVIRGGNLNEGGFSDDKFVFISEEKAQSLKRSLAFPDDLVFTHRGTIGQVGIIPHDKYPKYLVSQSQMKLTANKEYIFPKFLYYFFKSRVGQYELLKNSSQVGVPAIAQPTASLKEIDITIPSIEEQRRIAEILSALDDKIELNRQTNATLEAIAQAIFKEWFVDFNFPGATGEMIESDLGPIPKGWRVGKLGEVCENIRKGIYPNDIPQGTAYVGLEHIPRKFLGLLSWGVSENIASQKSHFKKYDILFGKLRPYFHKVCIAPVDGICSTDILVIRPNRDVFFSFCLNYLFSDELIKYVSAIADGTRMPRVDWKSISSYQIPISPENLLSEFNKITFPLYNTIIETNQESVNLAEVRDSILPKLMNGEIKI